MASDRAIRQMTMLNRLDLTETVSYMVTGQDARAIQATVDRGGAEPIMQGLVMGMQICVLNDGSVGIDAATLDVGADRIEVAERIGGAAKARGIQRVISQDADWLMLAVM